MELIWLVLSLLAIDLAALLFGADTRPGLQHSARWPHRPSARWPSRHASRSPSGHASRG